MPPLDELEELEMRLLLEGILARYGYDLRQYSAPSMRRRMQHALRRSGLADFGALQHDVLCDADVFASFLDDLTVQVSDMFRDPLVYRVFREHVLVQLRPHPLIKIWHAGCAGGEEVYSSAILFSETDLYERAQIYASDLSCQALHRAKAGIFPLGREPIFSRNYLASGGAGRFDQYYSVGYEYISMSDRLRKNVFFFQHNLGTDQSLGEMQVVFCRNVLIYFNSLLRDSVLRKLTDSICHGGFLVLGLGERLPPWALSSGFEEFSSEARIYRYWGRE
jgi:chemotaxis protein methyltransferase CheR